MFNKSQAVNPLLLKSDVKIVQQVVFLDVKIIYEQVLTVPAVVHTNFI
jgi:hypothetical protein